MIDQPSSKDKHNETYTAIIDIITTNGRLVNFFIEFFFFSTLPFDHFIRALIFLWEIVSSIIVPVLMLISASLEKFKSIAKTDQLFGSVLLKDTLSGIETKTN